MDGGHLWWMGGWGILVVDGGILIVDGWMGDIGSGWVDGGTLIVDG